MGIGFTTGVESNCVADDPGGSDQQSFVRAGVPGVQIFTGGHADYHRPTDDVEKVDAAGMVKVAVFAREALVYLAERPEPLTSTLGETGERTAPTPPQPASARRVSLGTMPDFAFPGPGVKVAQVLEGSAAEAAGILPGDLVLAIDGVEVASLRGYSDLLKRHAPGDVVTIRLRRGAEEVEVEATLKAR
jgi:predicted metalloprotease with PDZ domain